MNDTITIEIRVDREGYVYAWSRPIQKEEPEYPPIPDGFVECDPADPRVTHFAFIHEPTGRTVTWQPMACFNQRRPDYVDDCHHAYIRPMTCEKEEAE